MTESRYLPHGQTWRMVCQNANEAIAIFHRSQQAIAAEYPACCGVADFTITDQEAWKVLERASSAVRHTAWAELRAAIA